MKNLVKTFLMTELGKGAAVPAVELVRPVTGLVLQPWGSSTDTISNWDGDGIPRPTRMSPLRSSRVYARRLAPRLETSSVGHVAPSTTRKIGSEPKLAAKRACTLFALTLQPVCGWWQVKQVRWLVPRFWKKGFPAVRVAPPG